jgi:carbon storage regulator
MLVLSRKESQRIRLGDSIVVTIVKISGDKVRVGIEAPADVLVLRDELEARTPPSDRSSSERSTLSTDGRGAAISADCPVTLQKSA